jgi:hypothetical protein
MKLMDSAEKFQRSFLSSVICHHIDVYRDKYSLLVKTHSRDIRFHALSFVYKPSATSVVLPNGTEISAEPTTLTDMQSTS